MQRSLIERSFALAFLLAAAACTSAGVTRTPETVAPPARPAVTLGEFEIKGIAELIRIEDRREYDAATLDRYHRAAHPELRRRAALAAGRIRAPQAVPALLVALGDPDAGVRAEAAFALGQIGDTAATVVGALAGRALDPEEDPEVRTEAVATLGKLGTVEARIAVEAILENASRPEAAGTDDQVTGEALLAIWKFRRVEGMTGPVVRIAGSGGSELRWRAVYALMRLGDPGTVQSLLDHRSDPDPLVRALALRGLQPAVVDSSGRRAAAIDALTGAVSDPHPHVRINALRALAAFRVPESTSTLERAIEDVDANVALAAIESLAEVGGERAVAALEILARDPGTRIALRAAALAGLLRNDPDRGTQIAGGLSRDTHWLNRLYAARALTAAPKDWGVPRLIELAYDDDPRVASTALSGLATVPAEDAPDLHRLFIEQLGAADLGTRAAALRGIARRATPAELPVLLDAYERAGHDKENDAALAAVAALGALAEQGVPVARSFFQRFPRSPDPIVRREVREKLGAGNWGEIYPVETGRGSEFYESIARTLVAPDLAGAPRPRAQIRTAAGTITIELRPADAPLTVHNFITLAQQGYFDGFRWHRVVPNFVLQDGDPRGDGLGGPGYTIRDEINRIRYLRGTVGMALAGPDTGGSQFFITHAPQPHLDGGYTVFGQVVAGIDAADRVAQDDGIERINIQLPDGELPHPPTGTLEGGPSREPSDT